MFYELGGWGEGEPCVQLSLMLDEEQLLKVMALQQDPGFQLLLQLSNPLSTHVLQQPVAGRG